MKKFTQKLLHKKSLLKTCVQKKPAHSRPVIFNYYGEIYVFSELDSMLLY